jgi:hypothetical protein
MNIDKKTLSLLSLLAIVGIILMPYFKGGLILIPVAMCAIGGLCLGILIGKK